MVHYFYDWSGELSDDGEGGLVTLCGRCAAEQGENVQKAQRGDDESCCALCDAANDPEYRRHIDALIAA
jgi:hypothetical protein